MARSPLVPHLENEWGQALRLAAVNVYEHGTTSEVDVYAAETGGSVLTQPVRTDQQGEVELWTEYIGLVDVLFTDDGQVVDRSGTRRPMRGPVGETRLVGGLVIDSDPTKLPTAGGEMTGDIVMVNGLGVAVDGFPFSGLRFGVSDPEDVGIFGTGSSYVTAKATSSFVGDAVDIYGEDGVFLTSPGGIQAFNDVLFPDGAGLGIGLGGFPLAGFRFGVGSNGDIGMFGLLGDGGSYVAIYGADDSLDLYGNNGFCITGPRGSICTNEADGFYISASGIVPRFIFDQSRVDFVNPCIIRGVVDPVQDQDAATKKYVDDAIAAALGP